MRSWISSTWYFGKLPAASQQRHSIGRVTAAAALTIGVLMTAASAEKGAVSAQAAEFATSTCPHGAVGLIQGTSGRIEAKHPRKAWHRVTKRTVLHARDELRAAGRSVAAVHLCAGGALYLNQTTEVRFPDGRSTQVITGEVDARLSSGNERLEASHATVTNSGDHSANLDMRMDRQHTVVTTVEGALEVRTKHGNLTLPVDQQTQVVGDAAPQTPVTVDAPSLTTWTSPFTWKVFANLGESKPTRLAADAQGNIYVTEEFEGHVLKLSPSGHLLATWGSKGDNPGQLDHPYGITLDSAGNIYVADGGRDQIVKLSPSGQEVAAWGSYGSDPGRFNTPEGVAVDSAGNMYVADTGNQRVQKLSPNGDPLAEWGTEGFNLGQFRGPQAIALDRVGNIYVADWGDAYLTDRVVKLSPSGQFLVQWGGPQGKGLGQFNTPDDLTVDSQGTIYVAEGGNARIQEISSTDGRPLGSLGTYGSGLGQFVYGQPNGVAVDTHGNLYTAEEDAHRIQRYSQ